MTFEEELEQLQNDALSEIEDTDDTNENDYIEEQSDDDTDDDTGLEDDREEDEQDSDSDDIDDDTEEREDIDGELEDDDSQELDEDEADGESSNDKTNSSDFEPITIKVNGNEITLDSKDELQKYMVKMENNKPSKRKSKNDQLIEQSGLSESDIQLLVDAKKGNKAALAKLASDAKIDLLDIEEGMDSKYEAEFKPSYMSEVDEIAEDIMNNEPLYEKFQGAVKSVPQDFVQAISNDASALKHFAGHVESGLAEKIIPLATKAAMLNDEPFLNAYARIGREISESTPSEKKVEKRKVNPRADQLRKRASKTKGSNKGTKSVDSADDVWNMSTEDFNKKYG